MIEPCMRGVGAKAAAQITAITMDAIAKSEIHVLFAERTRAWTKVPRRREREHVVRRRHLPPTRN